MGTFTIEELNAYEQTFKVPQVAKEPVVESPPVEPEPTAEAPPAVEPEGDVVDEADSTPADAADASAPADVPPKGSARERIEDLVAERNALKKYIEYRDSLEQRQAPPPKTETPIAATDAAPTLESCQFDTDKWTQAMNAWTQKQIQSGIKQALQTEKQTATAEDQRAKFEQRMEAQAKAIPDFKTVLGNPSLPQLHKDAAALVVASDLGPQILYHLGKNPEKAARIARQTPIQQAAAVGRLEAELKAPKLPKLSNAPAPPTPNRGGDAPKLDDTKMTLADFVAKERARLAERRKRH